MNLSSNVRKDRHWFQHSPNLPYRNQPVSASDSLIASERSLSSAGRAAQQVIAAQQA